MYRCCYYPIIIATSGKSYEINTRAMKSLLLSTGIEALLLVLFTRAYRKTWPTSDWKIMKFSEFRFCLRTKVYHFSHIMNRR